MNFRFGHIAASRLTNPSGGNQPLRSLTYRVSSAVSLVMAVMRGQKVWNGRLVR